MSPKTHMKVYGPDYRHMGQTDEEYNNQALCGYAGVSVTRHAVRVNCKHCLAKIKKNNYRSSKPNL